MSASGTQPSTGNLVNDQIDVRSGTQPSGAVTSNGSEDNRISSYPHGGKEDVYNNVIGGHEPSNDPNWQDPGSAKAAKVDTRAADSLTGTGTGIGYGSGSSGPNAGPHNSKLANEADPRVDHDLDQTTNTNKTGTKPSLMDRLNPMKDSDHDGKKGFND